jgi:uncharacterized protein YqgV (UPF0045/DUF77 family)
MENDFIYKKLDCPFDFTSRCTMGSCDCKPVEEPKDVVLGYKTSIVAQMLDSNNKQETIEEAAERILSKEGIKLHPSGLETYLKGNVINAMVEMVKWQAERMYSEQEVLSIIDSFEKLCYNYQSNKDWFPSKKSEWFKQVKK